MSLIFWLLIVPATLLQADPMYSRSSTQVLTLNGLYRADGRSAPLISFPVTRRELAQQAERLLKLTDDADLQADIEHFLLEIAVPDDSGPRIGGHIRSTAHAQSVDVSEYIPHDLARALLQVPPYITTQLYLEHPEGILLSIRDDRQLEYRRAEHNNLPQFVPGNPTTPENNSIREGYIAGSVGVADITFGRHNIEVGPSPFSSLVISPVVPFLDALRITTALGPVRMTYFASTLENRAADRDVTIRRNNDEESEFYDFDRNTIFFNLHYFEYHFGRVRAGIGSHVVIARPMNQFHLGDFFPVDSWHNHNFTPKNIALIGDISLLLHPEAELYVIYGLDDVYGESIGIGDDDTPTIWAYIAGAQGSSALPIGSLRWAAEIGSTHYLWGSFDTGEELARAIYRMDLSGPNQLMPLTGRYGPGVQWLAARLQQDVGSMLSLQFNLELLGRTSANLIDTPYQRNDDLLSETRRMEMHTSLRTEYTPLRGLKLMLEPGVRLLDEIWQPTIAGSISYTWRFEQIVP